MVPDSQNTTRAVWCAQAVIHMALGSSVPGQVLNSTRAPGMRPECSLIVEPDSHLLEFLTLRGNALSSKAHLQTRITCTLCKVSLKDSRHERPVISHRLLQHQSGIQRSMTHKQHINRAGVRTLGYKLSCNEYRSMDSTNTPGRCLLKFTYKFFQKWSGSH